MMMMTKVVSAMALAFGLAGLVHAQGTSFNLGGPAGDKPAAKVTAAIVSEVKSAVPGQPFQVAVKLEHAPDHHTYGKVLPPDVIGKPTTLRWTLPDGWTLEELPWPLTHQVPSTDGKVSEGYDGVVYLPAKVTPAGEIGSTGEIAVTVDALVCDPKSCMPFKTEVKLSINLSATAELEPAMAEVFGNMADAGVASMQRPGSFGLPIEDDGKPKRSFLGYMLFALIGGLILNIMPCVFPVLGIKIMHVVRQAGDDRRQIAIHGLAYTAGVLVCFWALAALLIALKASGQNLGWGFQLQSPVFVYVLTFFLFLFALNLAGLFEMGSSAVGVGHELQSKQGYSGSFFTGLLATIVATPCSAPFLGPALGFALALPASTSLLLFTAMGVGLALPYLLLSFSPDLVRLLPRPGPWMESFKQFMSFLLFATVAYLLWTLDGMIDDLMLRATLFGLVLVALGAWIYGRWTLPHKPAAIRIRAAIIAIAVTVAGLWMAWPAAHKGELEWKEWSPELVQSLRDEGAPVYIDYTARWCATCQVNKRVYKHKEIKELMRKHKVVLLKADWTNEDERITKALADLDKAAVPVNVLYVPGIKEPHVLPELLTVENVKAALARLAN